MIINKIKTNNYQTNNNLPSPLPSPPPQQIDRYAPPHCQKIILGNKSDLAEEGGGRGREVEEDEGREYAEGLPVAIPFLEISVKEGIGIEEAFDLLVLNIKHWFVGGSGDVGYWCWCCLVVFSLIIIIILMIITFLIIL